MEQLGYIRGFGAYTPSMLERAKSDLGLSMPADILAFCAKYYAKERRYDPTIEEMHLLDGLFAGASSPSYFAPTQLFTNDDFVADTFADLMEKRRECTRDTDMPATLFELATVLDAYLERVGGRNPLKELCPRVKRGSDLPSRDTDRTVLSSNLSPFCVQIPEKTTVKKASVGDWFVLLRPAEGQLFFEYEDAADTLLREKAISSRIVDRVKITERGLLSSLLTVTDGARLELVHLGTPDEPIALQELNTGYRGEILLRVTKDAPAFLRQLCGPQGLKVLVFGVATKEPSVTLQQSKNVTYTWKTDFLRALTDMHTVSAYLKNAGELTSPIRCDDVCESGELLCAAASASPRDSFFLHALYTALAPVCALAASGIPYEEVSIGFGLDLPSRSLGDQNVGDALSVLLGIYRAQAELGIPCFSPCISTSEDCKSPRLSVFALGKKKRNTKAFPSQLTKPGSRIYCLKPDADQNGLPDFASLRSLLRAVTAWAQSGLLHASYPVCACPLTDGLLHMSSEALSFKLEEGTELAAEILPLGILVESDAELPAVLTASAVACEKSPLPRYEKEN